LKVLGAPITGARMGIWAKAAMKASNCLFVSAACSSRLASFSSSSMLILMLFFG
jgi:hypothetical protein